MASGAVEVVEGPQPLRNTPTTAMESISSELVIFMDLLLGRDQGRITSLF
jgi:hypothetical protein